MQEELSCDSCDYLIDKDGEDYCPMWDVKIQSRKLEGHKTYYWFESPVGFPTISSCEKCFRHSLK